jgi:ribosomal protein L37AE/L43A
MGQIQPMHPVVDGEARVVVDQPARPISSIVRCELCGAQLPEPSLRFALVSPRRRSTPIVACHTCRNAALGEGYRPAS